MIWGGEKNNKFQIKNSFKSEQNRIQEKTLVAKKLRKAFWTENWLITTRGTTGPVSWKGGGMDKSIPEGFFLYFILLYKQNDPKPPSPVGWWDLHNDDYVD